MSVTFWKNNFLVGCIKFLYLTMTWSWHGHDMTMTWPWRDVTWTWHSFKSLVPFSCGESQITKIHETYNVFLRRDWKRLFVEASQCGLIGSNQHLKDYSQRLSIAVLSSTWRSCVTSRVKFSSQRKPDGPSK